MTRTARLRVVPAIAFENDEGRLRHQAGEPRLESAQAAESGPHQPWSEDIYNVQMMSTIAIAILDTVFQDMKALEDLYEVPIRAHLRLDELAFQMHQADRAAKALQPQ